MCCPILLLSQLNRMAETRVGGTPMLSDLRESGAIEQDADRVMLLHRPNYYDDQANPNICTVIVAKNRRGRTGRVDLFWNASTTSFRNLTVEDSVEPLDKTFEWKSGGPEGGHSNFDSDPGIH